MKGEPLHTVIGTSVTVDAQLVAGGDAEENGEELPAVLVRPLTALLALLLASVLLFHTGILVVPSLLGATCISILHYMLAVVYCTSLSKLSSTLTSQFQHM